MDQATHNKIVFFIWGIADDVLRDLFKRGKFAFKETPQSKIIPNAAFGYWKVTVERPLRLHSQLSVKAIESLRFTSGDEDLRAPLYDDSGYEISFTRHFYQPQPLRTLDAIRADILAVEN